MSIFPTKDELAAEIKRLDGVAASNPFSDIWVSMADDVVHSAINKVLATAANADSKKLFWMNLLAGIAGGVAAHFANEEKNNGTLEELADATSAAETIQPAIDMLTLMLERAKKLTPDEEARLNRSAIADAQRGVHL